MTDRELKTDTQYLPAFLEIVKQQQELNLFSQKINIFIEAPIEKELLRIKASIDTTKTFPTELALCSLKKNRLNPFRVVPSDHRSLAFVTCWEVLTKKRLVELKLFSSLADLFKEIDAAIDTLKKLQKKPQSETCKKLLNKAIRFKNILRNKTQKFAPTDDLATFANVLIAMKLFNPRSGIYDDILDTLTKLNGWIISDAYFLKNMLYDQKKNNLTMLICGDAHAKIASKVAQELGYKIKVAKGYLGPSTAETHPDDISRTPISPKELCAFTNYFLSCCNYCGKPAKSKCSTCKKTKYCNESCQTEDWKMHKQYCKKI